MKKLSILIIFIIFISGLLSGCFLFDPHNTDYKEANNLFENGEFKAAAEMFAGLSEYDYKDSKEREKQSLYFYAGECFDRQDFNEAIKIYDSIDSYLDSADKKQETENESVYVSAIEYMNNQEYPSAKDLFENIREYKDSEEYIAAIIYIQANDIMQNDPDKAIDMLISIINYQGTGELAEDIVINKILSYIQDKYYEKAVAILEKLEFSETTSHQSSNELLELCNKNIKYDKALSDFENEKYSEAAENFKEISGFKDADEKFELCNNYIKYNQAISDFNAGKSDLAYNAFNELKSFSDSAEYMIYIDAGNDAKAKKYGESAKKYLSVFDFLDSKFLYIEYLYLYYDKQYQLGYKDLTKLALLPYNQTEIDNFVNNLKGEDSDIFYDKYNSRGSLSYIWRKMRVNNLKSNIENAEGLTEYFARTDTSTLMNITGNCIYINNSWSEYGAYDLSNKIIDDVPVFFLADSSEKVRYIMNFKGSAQYYGTYSDGTIGYETTLTVMIKDTVTGQILLYKNYTSYPPFRTSIWGDVYAWVDFFEKEEDGRSLYEKDIFPVLSKLFE
ncbi:MAG: hypothetical protein FWF92_04480 [Oscillospiraceae bacterium]|nr:hypothetical protein [Oscillospiraceae bacterium]